MTGERSETRVRLAPQPGDRQPAPGGLAVVQAFLNTHFDLGQDFGAEILRSPGALATWLRRAGLLAGPARLGAHDLERALELRAGLRALAGGSGREASRARERLDALAVGAAIQLRFAAPGPVLTGGGAGFAGALGTLLASSAQAMLDGRWSRLKVCPGHHCGWVFYDHSRNRSGRWCSMSVCGGREKARAHYRRRREA